MTASISACKCSELFSALQDRVASQGIAFARMIESNDAISDMIFSFRLLTVSGRSEGDKAVSGTSKIRSRLDIKNHIFRNHFVPGLLRTTLVRKTLNEICCHWQRSFAILLVESMFKEAHELSKKRTFTNCSWTRTWRKGFFGHKLVNFQVSPTRSFLLETCTWKPGGYIFQNGRQVYQERLLECQLQQRHSRPLPRLIVRFLNRNSISNFIVAANILNIILIAPCRIQKLNTLTIECGQRSCRVWQVVDVEMLEPLVFG